LSEIHSSNEHIQEWNTLQEKVNNLPVNKAHAGNVAATLLQRYLGEYQIATL